MDDQANNAPKITKPTGVAASWHHAWPQMWPPTPTHATPRKFDAAVMNWIAEATSAMNLTGGSRSIMADACSACWAAYGYETTNAESEPVASFADIRPPTAMTFAQHDAAPAAGQPSVAAEDTRVRASASSTGNTQEPVAWRVVNAAGAQFTYDTYKGAERAAGDLVVEPLYTQPALTTEERESIEIVADWAEDHLGEDDLGVVALRNLLERTK